NRALPARNPYFTRALSGSSPRFLLNPVAGPSSNLPCGKSIEKRLQDRTWSRFIKLSAQSIFVRSGFSADLGRTPLQRDNIIGPRTAVVNGFWTSILKYFSP